MNNGDELAERRRLRAQWDEVESALDDLGREAFRAGLWIGIAIGLGVGLVTLVVSMVVA